MKPHWSFWVIGVFGLIWHAMGVMNMVIQMNPDQLANFPEEYQAIIAARPMWATIAFAVAMIGGTLGSILLLLRKASAKMVFSIAALATILVVLSMIGQPYSSAIAGAILSVILIGLLAWYADYAKRRDWVS